MIISLDADKPFDKIQHLFMLKDLKDRNSRPIYKHSTSNVQQNCSQHQTNWRETYSSPIKIKDETRLPISSYLFNIAQSPSQSNFKTKGGQSIQIGKEEEKISLFADVMILFLSDPQNSTTELQNLINRFRKVAGYNINSNKSVLPLHSKDKQAKKEVREMALFTIITNNLHQNSHSILHSS